MAELNAEEIKWAETATRIGGVAKNITPEESNFDDLLNPDPKAIYIVNGGTMKVTLMSGSVVEFTGMPSDYYIDWLRIKRLWSTGSTAGPIIALY